MASYYDVAIIGLGAMGSAAAFHMARRNLSVVGIDQYSPPHELGSSHGESRIIREAYYEHPSYVPIVQRAYELWEQLEQYTGRKLLVQTGGLMIGHPDGELVTGSELSARRHHIPYDRLIPAEVRARYPAFNMPEDSIAIWDPRAGILYPEACVEAHLQAARKTGAELRYDTKVIAWEVDDDNVTIHTSEEEYRARHLVICAGAWVGELLTELDLPLAVERQVLCWFQPAANPEQFEPERFPIFVWETGPGMHFYGFPDLGTGVKVARMHHGETTTPNDLRRETDSADVEVIRDFLSGSIPDANGQNLNAQACMFINTPDLHFLIDYHPNYRQVLIASPCSGHGFKFSSAIGEIIADLVSGDDSQYDLNQFRIDRFAG